MKASNVSKLTVLTALTLLLTALSIGFEGGDGTSSSPYEIATCEQLQDMQSDLSANYELVDNIDCTMTDDWNGGDGFNPVGTFTGSLEGSNYEIEGLFVDRPNRHVGLFDITNGADIRNLGVVDAEVIGERRVAHIVGNTDGSTLIENVYSEGTVRGLGDGSWAQAGAIVGRMESSSKVRNAYSNTDLESVDDSAHGSLIGFMRDDSQIENVYALGEVVDMDTDSPDRIGGLIGDFYDEQPEVRNAYSSALVDASGSTVGGFLGNDDSSASPSVADSYWDIDTSGQTSSAGDPEGLSNENMQGAESGDNMEFDFESTWSTVENGDEIISTGTGKPNETIIPEEDGYPVLRGVDIKTQLEAQGIGYTTQEIEIVAFEETGEHTWEVPSGVDEVDVLVVGGGGAGGGRSGGGGGAGGVKHQAVSIDSRESIDITVGAGGEQDNPGPDGSDATQGESGESSRFGDYLTALGGGGGGSDESIEDCESSSASQGCDGGSGGGGRYGEEGGDSIGEGIGNVGGFGTGDDYNGGGGGGAGEPGEDGTNGDSSSGGEVGDGGDGLYIGDEFGNHIGNNGWIAGGGGGGSHSTAGDDLLPNEYGYGGLGGGGDGGETNQDGGPGDPNTGGGGGAGSTDSSTGGVGGNGGSGIVVVKYQTDVSICDRRGPFEECVSDSSHSISGQEFTLENIFEAEDTAVFQALTEKASISVSNSTSISGLWEGSFDIQSEDGARVEAGAEFRPEGGRITIN